MAALETVVRRLETAETTLDGAIADYEYGMRLKRQCEARLAAARLEVERITTGTLNTGTLNVGTGTAGTGAGDPDPSAAPDAALPGDR